MKTTSLLLTPMLSLAFLLAAARAEPPTPAELTPAVQALLADLLKRADQPGPELAAVATAPDPAPAARADTARPVRPPLGSASSLRTGSLVTRSLTSGRLAPSPALAERLSNSDWRLLFPKL